MQLTAWPTLMLTNINNYLAPQIIIIKHLFKNKTLLGGGSPYPKDPLWIRPWYHRQVKTMHMQATYSPYTYNM